MDNSRSAALADQIAIVTGAGSGLGAAISRRLAADGAHVVVNDLDPASADAIATEVGGSPSVFDVTDSAALDAAFDRVLERHGRLDIVVNNAGIIDDRPDVTERSIAASVTRAEGRTPDPIRSLSSVTDEAFERMIRVHVHGTFYGMRAALRHMEAVERGSIVNVSSIYGLRGAVGQPAYSAAKHAIIGLTRSAGCEVAPLGVRVNAVVPGFIDTPLLDPVGEMKDLLRQQIPADRLGRPDEVAEAVRFLAGPESSYCNGDVLTLTGGFNG